METQVEVTVFLLDVVMWVEKVTCVLAVAGA